MYMCKLNTDDILYKLLYMYSYYWIYKYYFGILGGTEDIFITLI